MNSSASLFVMADHVDRYRQEIGDLVPFFQLHERDDVVTALVEAERALRAAARSLQRAGRLVEESQSG